MEAQEVRQLCLSPLPNLGLAMSRPTKPKVLKFFLISVLGIVVALTVTLFLLNLRRYPSIFFQSILVADEDEMDSRLRNQRSEESKI